MVRMAAHLQLGHHATADGAVRHERGHVGERELREQLHVLIEHAGDVREEHQALGLQGAGDGAGGRIGVHVVAPAFCVHPDGRHHRNDALGGEVPKQGHIHNVGLAHEPKVHLDGAAALRVHNLLLRLLGAQNVPVLPAEAHGLAAGELDGAHDALVDGPGQHHLRHLHGGLVRHAQTLHELGLDVQLGEHVLDLRPAAVHDDNVDTHGLEQHHVARELLREGLIHHGVAAVLHHDKLARIPLDVRQRPRQDLARNGRARDAALIVGNRAQLRSRHSRRRRRAPLHRQERRHERQARGPKQPTQRHFKNKACAVASSLLLAASP
mmetsp:Transcript_6998/g.20438  ORF Transcript_6998/g.20438 Transcript_6998/m.20438 type:complete len:324 (+) Transcript_6998:362-1333(+)